jgi:hypothetical protein
MHIISLSKKTLIPYDFFIQQSCKVESIGVIPKEPNYPGHEGRNGLSKVIESQFLLVKVAYAYT